MEWLEGEMYWKIACRALSGTGGCRARGYRVLDALAAAMSAACPSRYQTKQHLSGGLAAQPTRAPRFGIARRVLDPKRFTHKGFDRGTPLYARPSRLAAVRRGCRADIFSSDVCLYEALTVNRLTEQCHRGDAEGVRGTWYRLSSRRFERARAEQIIHRMLAPDPDARPQSAGIVAGEFRALAQRLGDLARKPPRQATFPCGQLHQRPRSGTICAMLNLAGARPPVDVARTVRDPRPTPRGIPCRPRSRRLKSRKTAGALAPWRHDTGAGGEMDVIDSGTLW